MRLLREAARYWHTVRHLRLVQVTARAGNCLHRPRPDLSPAPKQRPVTETLIALPGRPPALLHPWRFTFLGQEHDVDRPRDWTAATHDKLWLYNLHYFADLNSTGSSDRAAWHRQLLDRWMRENPPGSGVGWEAYPTSLRIANWIKWAVSGNLFEPVWAQSLAVQARWLARHVEYHLLGNHLLANAKGLICAGLFFEGTEAASWLGQGSRLLDRELNEQVLPDGGHIERSPMYHALVLEDLLDLLNVYRAYGQPSPTWRWKVDAVRAWLRAMTHPDGEISFFNDAALGVAPSPPAIEAYARRLGCGRLDDRDSSLVYLRDSGYARLSRGSKLVIADGAALGPDYQPGHGHADTLTFELSTGRDRLIVNSGTSTYTPGPERQRQRSTSAHNTVTIDGADSSEVWASFRVARRARATCIRAEQDGDVTVFEAAHDGYQRLAGAPIHRRRWRLSDHELEVTDWVEGLGTHQVEWRFHLHPDIEPAFRGQRVITLTRDGRLIAEVNLDLLPAWELEKTTYHPRFGQTLPNAVITGRATARLPLQATVRVLLRYYDTFRD